MGIHNVVTMLLFEFTVLTISLTAFSAIVYISSYQFMSYMARTTYSESDTSKIFNYIDVRSANPVPHFELFLVIVAFGTIERELDALEADFGSLVLRSATETS
ncbi:uncharacterized protein LOC143905640 [Temnothorax americanus]|uniref:uncharacterized protein LOC143905640 n=1 Tax=Temnothorax americanus TaxID=1964332 RepID=UPI0040675E55